MIQLGLCNKVTQLLERLIGFTGMSDDKCRAQEDSRKVLAGPLDHCVHALPGIPTTHQLELVVINVLERTVDVTDHTG